ncbi:hypothetical protein C4565_03075 [Candidatus Parcubacteria bacterium]|nr:MAG: hypothetical protein C4565_03075 [Candidatus Parcubacteria bacterium]
MELFGSSMPLCVFVFLVTLVIEIVIITRVTFFSSEKKSRRGCHYVFLGGCAVALSFLWMLLYFFSSTFER